MYIHEKPLLYADLCLSFRSVQQSRDLVLKATKCLLAAPNNPILVYQRKVWLLLLVVEEPQCCAALKPVRGNTWN